MRAAWAALVFGCFVAGAAGQAEELEGMVWIGGGSFAMGSDARGSRADERPVHTVDVAGFWMDRTEVTNDQFAAFVEATGYVTTAERPVDWDLLRAPLPEGTPKPDEAALAPGALVFAPPERGEAVMNAGWWTWTPGARWRHPAGPSSTIEGLGDHPVVQVSHDDARAYAAWAGKRLPTEAEWEFAARGGMAGKPFPWGDEAVDPSRANIWQGRFPYFDTEEDGFGGTSPVGTFAANGYGLVDMAGNVWEWCADAYSPAGYGDGAERDAHQRVLRGGSFLCHASYCSGYRVSARMKSSADSGLMHVGFRCVRGVDVRATTPPTAPPSGP